MRPAIGPAQVRNPRRSSSLAIVFCVLGLCLDHEAAMAAVDGDGFGDRQDVARSDPDGLSLEAGEFAWLSGADENSSAPVTLLVSLRDQRGYLYREGRRIAVTTVSTGRPGYDTPTGVFPIMGKKKTHYSNRYDNAPMPWMQRLTRWGHALHAGDVRSVPASHGCIRLPTEFARQLFELTRTGDLVVISQDVSPRSLAIALAIAGADSATAQLVGVTEPLPRIILVPYRPQKASEKMGVVGAAEVTGY
jgi:hypothetical protein